jgi:site-specific recombinase
MNPMNDSPTPITATENTPVDLAVACADRIREKLGDTPEKARRALAEITRALDNDAKLRATCRAALLGILDERRQVSFYSDTGVLPNTGFFTECFRRVTESVLPGTNDRVTLRDVVGEIFDRPSDANRILDAGPEAWTALLAALRFDEVADDPAARRVIAHSLAQMMEALRVISYRISALGLEDEVLRLDPSLEKFASPFLAQNVEALVYLDAYDRWLADPTAPVYDEKHLLVLLLQCRSVAAGIRRRAANSGTSFHLTFLLVRLEQNTIRAETIADILNTYEEKRGAPELLPELLPKLAALATGLVREECRKNDLGEYFRQTLRLMSLRITENASHTGEHYITESRAEWFGMLRAGLGAGFIIAFMGLLKVYLGYGEMAPVPRIILYGLDYGLGFVLIHILHFTVATKQPAMTANAIAAAIGNGSGKARDIDNLVYIVRRTARSQLAAIAGNLLLVIPTSILIILTLRAVLGETPFTPEKIDYFLHASHPWLSGSVFYAALAGVFLFLAGLVTGYFDNLCAYNRIPDRMRQAKWLVRLLGRDRLLSVARYVEDNLGALAGNLVFGFMLAGGWGLGVLVGLPIDIRHITFSSAFASFAVAAQDFTTAPGVWIPAFVGVALIGAINLAVSFTLALFVALRSRGATLDAPRLLLAIARDFRRQPGRYFFPPKATAATVADETGDKARA